MDIHIEQRRERVSKEWNLTDEVVLIYAGKPIGIPGGSDQTFPFKPHPQYRWLTDRKREGGVLGYDPRDGWALFEPAISQMELVWGGGPPPVGRSLGELGPWLEARHGRKLAVLGSFEDIQYVDNDLSDLLHVQLDHVRRAKDGLELDLLQRSALATRLGYQAITKFIAVGVTEREIQNEFEYAIAKAGASGLGYPTIVGSGPNSGVLHFAPTDRIVKDGDCVLVDAGAEFDSYVTDVTRTFAGNGKFSQDQQWLYNSVKQSLEKSIEACQVGVEWVDIHRIAAASLASSLLEGDLLKCSPEEAIESGAIGLFFPHGIGHMVGLGVRDAGGPLPGRKGLRKVADTAIRMDLPLGAGYVVTIEPGVYFIPALLNDPAKRAKFDGQVCWEAVESWIGTGGIRLEDNILITETGPINLTQSIPK